MSRYELWVFLHVTSVIVWIGAGTTLALIAFYAQSRDGALRERLADLHAWLGRRVFAPSAVAALAFGVVAARSGHWSSPLWIRLGYVAIATSILLNLALRFPLLRRIQGGAISPTRGIYLLRSLAVVELAVLYLAVADMIAKPTSSDTGTLSGSGGVLALAVLIAVAISASGRRVARN